MGGHRTPGRRDQRRRRRGSVGDDSRDVAAHRRRPHERARARSLGERSRRLLRERRRQARLSLGIGRPARAGERARTRLRGGGSGSRAEDRKSREKRAGARALQVTVLAVSDGRRVPVVTLEAADLASYMRQDLRGFLDAIGYFEPRHSRLRPSSSTSTAASPGRPGASRTAAWFTRAQTSTSAAPSPTRSWCSRDLRPFRLTESEWSAGLDGVRIPHTSASSTTQTTLASRTHPAGGRRELPPVPGDPRKQPRETPCSRRESPLIPAQPGTTMTGLSRRRSRVRVPSLPSFRSLYSCGIAA
jgi:hypothetical protein